MKTSRKLLSSFVTVNSLSIVLLFSGIFIFQYNVKRNLALLNHFESLLFAQLQFRENNLISSYNFLACRCLAFDDLFSSLINEGAHHHILQHLHRIYAVVYILFMFKIDFALYQLNCHLFIFAVSVSVSTSVCHSFASFETK